MSDSVPTGARARNAAPSPLAARPFVVLHTLPAGPDAARRVVQRRDLEAAPDSIRPLALLMLEREQVRHGRNVDVQVFDVRGALVFASPELPAAVVRHDVAALHAGLRCDLCGWQMRVADAGECPRCRADFATLERREQRQGGAR